MARVTIQNEARTIEVPANANLRKALLDAKAPLYDGVRKILNCHGHGKCASCEILVIAGADQLSPRTPAEHKKLETYDVHSRLACQCSIIGDGEVVVNSLAL
ncbi:MAG: (2Fe-2S)-binding protein [Planctomycetes bacterium]|nr:(2Fe-2S)-binding protein [Planctomycetota bacterium]